MDQQTPGVSSVSNPGPQPGNTMPGAPTVTLHKKPSWLLPIVFIVVLAVIGAVVFQALKHLPAAPKKMSIGKTLPKGYTSSITGSNYPPGFPVQLVFEASVTPIKGENTVTGSGQSQKIVEYYSSSTPDFIYGIYQSGLLKAGWKQSVNINNQSSKVLVFTRPKNQAYQVIITPYQKGSQVKLVAINI